MFSCFRPWSSRCGTVATSTPKTTIVTSRRPRPRRPWPRRGRRHVRVTTLAARSSRRSLDGTPCGRAAECSGKCRYTRDTPPISADLAPRRSALTMREARPARSGQSVARSLDWAVRVRPGAPLPLSVRLWGLFDAGQRSAVREGDGLGFANLGDVKVEHELGIVGCRCDDDAGEVAVPVEGDQQVDANGKIGVGVPPV